MIKERSTQRFLPITALIACAGSTDSAGYGLFVRTYSLVMPHGRFTGALFSVIGMIPQGLVLLTSSVLAIAIRLGQK